MSNPEIGKTIRTGSFDTNYHDYGDGEAILFIHGSGPGVTAWANWRLALPLLEDRFRVLAPDMVGFGYTERPEGIKYDLDIWTTHAIDFLDALGLDKVNLVGNSYGGALSLALTIRHPERVKRLVLMGAAGVEFELTPGLDQVWGYEPSFEAMRDMMDLFAYDRSLVNDELANLRYQASLRPGVQEAFGNMFPAPRQQHISMLASPEKDIANINHSTLIVHGRDDRIIPLDTSLRLNQLIEDSQLHVFGRCGHWTQIEHTVRFCQLLGNFFEEE